jgi:23S rRNA A2030 N6-methylase RlmJ
VANVHFARVGDVWKHGPLVEVLTAMRPDRYVETHAGSASYRLTPSPERSYGAYRLLEAAAVAPEVAGSPYLDLLRRAAGAAESSFPGSPALAMAVLGDRARYLFCDTDPASAASIRRWAAAHGVPGVEAVIGDGPAAVRARVKARDHAAAGRTLVFLDPYQPFEAADPLGVSAADLLGDLAAGGVPALLWYGFDDAGRARVQARLRGVVEGAGRAAVWWAELVPAYLGDPEFPFHSGFVGCGLLGLGLSATAVAACAAYGRGLERIYRDVVLFDRHDGSLRYDQLA